jgi:hypothetical protein
MSEDIKVYVLDVAEEIAEYVPFEVADSSHLKVEVASA